MKQNSYLYGEGVEITPIPYEIVDERITALQSHLSKLLNVPMMERNEKKVRAVSNAITFWNKLAKKDT